MKPQVTPDISDPSHSHVLSCQHWTRAAIKLLSWCPSTLTIAVLPLLQCNVHILNCACAHEAPSNSSICDPSAFSFEKSNDFTNKQLCPFSEQVGLVI
ncbi:hypothetical protein MTR67_005988 [Solanum verrucosum]|uniref:Uncharacterized protein n=1 Tax=Solanum verrucosum TaxID=315347 RepID=A0AAF0PXG6_SOLVR|nr:hypothetical protein MTR67_005988 [Solanum verrucosum]